MATLSRANTGVLSRGNIIQQNNVLSSPVTEDSTNNGGVLGGVGYLGEKFAVGFMSSLEGIWDYSAGGIAKLFGADDWAEDQIANDWFGDWYSHPEEWYHPSKGWQIAGDVASGIGNSAASMVGMLAGVGVAAASGGTLAPLAAGMIGASIAAGLGAAGNATKEAYQKTGTLDGKAFGYGALSGLTEGALEGVTNLLTLGTGKIVKSVAGSLGRNVAKTAAKEAAEAGFKSTVKALGGAMIGEAFEEGMSEALSPYWKRMTYDPSAENATAEEIGYAAFVGGLSGLFMDGGRIATGTTSSYLKGNALARDGKASEVLELSDQLSSFQEKNQSDNEAFKYVSETYKKLSESLRSTGGVVSTVGQKRMLGDLQKANVSAVFTPLVTKSAANIVANADTIAEKLTAYGMKDASGKPLTFTADQIRAGVDTKNQKTLSKSFAKALESNNVLRTLAVADVTGHLMMDTAKFEQATLMGQKLASQVDINRFYETATPAEINAVSDALGIENWATLTPASLSEKIQNYITSGGAQAYADTKRAKAAFEAIPAESAQKMPSKLNLTADGAVRYAEGALSVAIEKRGDSYRIYDYGTGKLTRFVPAETVNSYLSTYRTQVDTAMAQEAARQREAAEVETFARKNVSEYKNLGDANQGMIRRLIRSGRAAGISDADLAIYARVSARSGLDIVFDKEATRRGTDANGTAQYADGYYSAAENRIVVNPEGTRSAERLLIHELDHAIRQSHGVTAYRQALEGVSDEVRQSIVRNYAGVADAGNRTALVLDETNARYAEDILSNKHTLERLVAAEPTLKERILSFFKGASSDYADTPKLSRVAKKYYRTYKKLFDSFAEGNYQGNAYGNIAKNQNAVKNAMKDMTPATKDLLVENAKTVTEMDLVTNLSGKEFSSDGKTSLKDRVVSFFNSFGNQVYNPDLGDIAVTTSSFRDDKGHGLTYNKVVSFSAIPEVLSNGKIIDIWTPEGKPYTRITVAAPISISGEKYYMGVMVQRDHQSQRMYLHDVITEKATLSFTTEPTAQNGEGIRDKGHLFITSILQNALNVNKKSEKTDKKFALPDNEADKSDVETDIKNIVVRSAYGYGVDAELLDFVNSISRMENQNAISKRKHLIGKISAKHAKIIEDVFKSELGLNIDAKDYTVNIDGSAVKHIEEKHGVNGTSDHSMESKEDVARVGWAVNNADSGHIARTQTGEVDYSAQYKNADGTPSPKLIIETSIGDGKFIVAECVPDTAAKRIHIISARKIKGGNGQVLNVESTDSPQPTSETLLDGITANDSITDSAEKVNRYSEKTDKKVALPDNEVTRAMREREDEKKRNFNYSDPLDMIDSVAKKKQLYDPNLKDKLFTNHASLRIDTVDELYGIEYYLRKVGGRADAEFLVNAARSSIGQAQTMIGSEQYDIFSETPKKLGKGLVEIIKPIKMRGDLAYRQFNEYLLHWRHIDSMMLKEPKPIFFKKQGEESIALLRKESEIRIAELEGIHPDFKKIAEEVWAYFKNVNHMRAEAGLTSRRTEKILNEKYPHYVPAMRDMSYDGHKLTQQKNIFAVSSTVKKAVGGDPDILDIFDAGAAQTKQVIRAGNINILARAIYDAAKKSGDTTYVDILLEEDIGDAEAEAADIDPIDLRPKDNQIIFLYNGKKITMNVAKEIYKGFEGLSQTTVDFDSTIMKAANKVNSGFKKLVTSYSPAFLIRNPIRDLQDAGLNSKHPAAFAKVLPRAYKELYQNGEYWKLYRAMGGFSSSVFESRGGITATVGKRGFESIETLFEVKKGGIRGAWQKISRPGKVLLTGIENVNAVVEQATRLAEFIASIEAGESAQQALYNSAEVTTNFGRRGRLTKKLNATIMPFLNPAIQGFDKMFRNVNDVIRGEHVAKGLSTLLAKVAIIGLVPMIVNMLMYDDDEDYEDLREEDKENNFLIKVGDVFIKIPRGRVASVIGGAANRVAKAAKGEDADWSGYVSNVVAQVTPVENMSRTIFSPFSDMKNNITWYGTAIEGREFETVAPKDRYDENTSSIAIAIGQKINYSPKKLHYLLDQYSGVIGDFILPMTTNKAEKDFLSGNFTLDPATSNKLSTEFYEMYDEAQFAKSAGDDTAIYQVKYLNQVKKAISDMYKQKSEIQNSDLSNVDKLQQTRVVQILINEAYKTALQDYAVYTQAIEATATIEEDSRFFNVLEACESMEAYERTVQTLRATEATRLMYGAERALSEYDTQVYDTCQFLNKAGIEYNTLYDYYFTTKGIESDVDRQGKTISGSKRKKVVAAINSLDVSVEKKLLLICAKGYSIQDGDVRGMSAERARTRLLRCILRMPGVSRAEKAEFAEMCGFEVRNGRIIQKNTSKS